MLSSRRDVCGALGAIAAAGITKWARAAPKIDDPVFLEAIREHLAYSVGFRAKLKSGYYRYPIQQASQEVVLKTYADILNRLGELSTRNPCYALIHYLAPDKRLHAWLLDTTGSIAKHVSDVPYGGLRDLQDALNVTTRARSRYPVRHSSTRGSQNENPTPRMDGAAALERAADTLLGPTIREALVQRHGMLYVLPARDTGSAPYAALTLGESQRLINRYATIIAPDISILADHLLVQEMQYVDWRTSFLMGDPDLSEDVEYYYPPLPGARKEILDVAQLIGAHPDRVFVGKEATLNRFIKSTAAYNSANIIYLASHAIADPTNPMDDSFVALTGGRLTGALVRAQRFEAWEAIHPIVILSACETALGKTFDGGSFGIARAIFAAGSAQVVASLWNVDDEATRSLMTDFMDDLYIGFETEIALANAQRKASLKFENDPAAWASFSVFGMPSRRTSR